MRKWKAIFALVLCVGLVGCVTTGGHYCEGCSLSIKSIKECHIPQLNRPDCGWAEARLRSADIILMIESGACTWRDLGVDKDWLEQRIKVARLNDIERAKRDLARWRQGYTDPNRAIRIRGPVISKACAWEDLGVTPEEREQIEQLANN